MQLKGFSYVISNWCAFIALGCFRVFPLSFHKEDNSEMETQCNKASKWSNTWHPHQKKNTCVKQYLYCIFSFSV